MEYFLEPTRQKFAALPLKIFKTRAEKNRWASASEEYTDGASRYTRVDPPEICLLRGTPVPGAKYSRKEGETAKMLFLWARAARTLLCPIGCLDGAAVGRVVQSSSLMSSRSSSSSLQHVYNACKNQIENKTEAEHVIDNCIIKEHFRRDFLFFFRVENSYLIVYKDDNNSFQIIQCNKRADIFAI